MSNKAQRVGSRGPYSTRLSRVLYGALRPHTTNLLCFSSVKHKTVLCVKGNSAV